MLEFGNVWTEAKLNAIEEYLGSYTTALRNVKYFKYCYIDGFAGDGSIKLKNGEIIDGSAIRAIKFPFNKDIFIDKDKNNLTVLKNKISYINEDKDVDYINSDCNEFFLNIDKTSWKIDNWRGVIFLDPFAMDMKFECLKSISNTKIFDVWYLFPIMALNRNFYRNGRIPTAIKTKITDIIGEGWEEYIYSDSPQQSLFGDKVLQKTDIEHIINYWLKKLGDVFPTVSPKAVILKNEKKSPQFLLCFTGSNPSERAKILSLNLADYILQQLERE